MNSRDPHINNISKYAYLFLCLACAGAYCGVLVAYGTNTPFLDDYYECLYFFYKFLNADLPQEKIDALLWQYSDHRSLITKGTFLVQYFLFGRIDFYWLSLIGIVPLFAVPVLIWTLLRFDTKESYAHLFFIFLFIVNLSLWGWTYWAVASFGGPLTIIFSALIPVLLSKEKAIYSFLSGLLLMLLVFTQGNGVLMIAISMLQVIVSGGSKQKKIGWIAYSIFLLVVNFSTLDYSDTLRNGYTNEDRLLIMLKSIADFPVSLMMFVGSAPFSLETNHEVWPGVLCGILVTWLLIHHLYLMKKYNDPRFIPVFSLVLFCYLSYILVAFIRGPFEEKSIAYSSHYKLYSLVIFSIALSLGVRSLTNKSIRLVCFWLICAIPIHSNYRDLPIIKKNMYDRKFDMAEWAVRGTYDSFKGHVKLEGQEQILFAAEKMGVYSPLDTARGALFQPDSITPVEKYELKNTLPIIDTEWANNKGAIAYGLKVDQSLISFDSVALQSNEKTYKVTPKNRLENKLIISKKLLANGNYNVIFLSSNIPVALGSNALFASPYKSGVRCRPTWTPPFYGRAYKEIKNEFCQKVYR